MEKFPLEFNFTETNNKFANEFEQTNKELLDNGRQCIYNQFIKYSEKNMEYFHVDLSEYSEEIRVILCRELAERFSLILLVSNEDDFAANSKNAWILPKILENEIVTPTFNNYIESLQIVIPKFNTIREGLKMIQNFSGAVEYHCNDKLGVIKKFFSRKKSGTIINYWRPIYAPTNIIVVLSQNMIDIIDSKYINKYDTLWNMFWSCDNITK